MILGMSLGIFTLSHVVISLLAMIAGITVLLGMLGAKCPGVWEALFLLTAILTSATGYLFPSNTLLPSHIFGALSLAVLALALLGLYAFRLRGAWRWIYVVSIAFAVYFDVFVAVAQAFAKLGFLRSLAPTQSEPPFNIAQVAVLIVFLAVGIAAMRRFHPEKPARLALAHASP